LVGDLNQFCERVVGGRIVTENDFDGIADLAQAAHGRFHDGVGLVANCRLCVQAHISEITPNPYRAALALFHSLGQDLGY
jgi:hypothetical protein